jgi:biopolymer transport protein ExbB
MMQHILDQAWGFYVLGGPVVGILAVLSVAAVAVILLKLWVYQRAHLGRNARLELVLADWDAGRPANLPASLAAERSPFAAVMSAAMSADGSAAATDRVDAMAEATLAEFEKGFRLLDAIAQTAPLLGLFGTVLGMIEAFQAMQGAGTSVDPSVLAGGIWVALLTTAVGLAVAIPTSLVLTWFEALVARERGWIAGALARIRSPDKAPPAATITRRTQAVLANAG